MSESVSPSYPLLWTTLRPVNSDTAELRRALAKLSGEDAAFIVDEEDVDGQVIIRAMSETQLEDICERLARKHNVYVESEPPQIIYLETISGTFAAEGKYIRRRNYAHVVIRIEPNPAKGYELVNESPASAIPAKYLQSIEQGIRHGLKSRIASHELTDVRVILCDGSYHEDDSNETAFEIAGLMAMEQAVRQSSFVLLEPVISLQIVVPQRLAEPVMADLRSRRAEITGIENDAKNSTIHAIVRLVQMVGYADDLRSITEETGAYSAELLRYSRVHDLPSGGDDRIGVTANKPRKPKPKSGAAAVEPPWPESNC
jgi:elongation factor G